MAPVDGAPVDGALVDGAPTDGAAADAALASVDRALVDVVSLSISRLTSADLFWTCGCMPPPIRAIVACADSSQTPPKRKMTKSPTVFRILFLH
jgi:hypothetical protein